MKQQIILFIEPAKEAWKCNESIGNLFMNRFAIDEDAAHEVLGVYYLKQSSYEMCNYQHEAYASNVIERQRKERFDRKTIAKGIKYAAKHRCYNTELHIFSAGLLHEDKSERIEYISHVLHKQKISSILLTQLTLTRIRLSSAEDVQLAYKDDQGCILYNPPDFDKMTEEQITRASFQANMC